MALEATDVAGAAVRVGEPGFDGGRLHWLVTPPSAAGNTVLVSWATGEPVRRESPSDASIRSRLYGYGAGSWCATPAGLAGVEARTQRLCRLEPDQVLPVEPGPAAAERLGDPASVPSTTWVVCVAEQRAPKAVALVAIDLATGERVELAAIDGFAAEISVDAGAAHLSWLAWPAATMPWDAAELHVGHLELAGGRPALRGDRRVDGGRSCSAGQPTWLDDGSLTYVGEAAGFWQPWRRDPNGVVRRLSGRRAEFQRPRWTTCRWLAAVGDQSLLCAFADADGEHVGVLDHDELTVVEQPCTRVDGVAADEARVAWVGATADEQGVVLVARRASLPELERVPAWAGEPTVQTRAVERVPVPRTFTFSCDGTELSGVRWSPPGSRDGAPPPLVVTVHPGPTGASDRSYSPLVHLLCANGIAVAAIDYSGSTGHGRRHRERLLGRYGELDVAECTAAARWLIDAGLADGRATFIRGTSAGGTTALLALCGDVFCGAAAWYPASRFDDEDTGFEAGYLASLLGDGGAERSPLARAPAMHGSVLVVQGADDEVVDPRDTELLVATLREHLDDVTSVSVPGEGHGFRTESGRAHALASELDFYRRCTVVGRGSDPRYDASNSGTRDRPGAP